MWYTCFWVGRTTGHGEKYRMMRMHGNEKDKLNIEVDVEGDVETIMKK